MSHVIMFLINDNKHKYRYKMQHKHSKCTTGAKGRHCLVRFPEYVKTGLKSTPASVLPSTSLEII